MHVQKFYWKKEIAYYLKTVALLHSSVSSISHVLIPNNLKTNLIKEDVWDFSQHILLFY